VTRSLCSCSFGSYHLAVCCTLCGGYINCDAI